MPNSDNRRQSLHRWPTKEGGYTQEQQTQTHHTKLFEVVRELGEVRASIDHLETASRETRTDLKAEAAMIKDMLDEISRRISSDYKAHDVKLDAVSQAHDARLDAIEIHLARQDAEAAGFRRALRWGAGALTALGSALGWMAATWGESLLSALGSGGAATGGK